jgi:hypothetical protein
MPVNNRNQSPRRRMPMNLEGRYGKIGISVVGCGRHNRASAALPSSVRAELRQE